MYIEKIREFVESECKKPTSKYGFLPFKLHFVPVHKYAKQLAENLKSSGKQVDVEVVELAAWLHDIGSIIYRRKNHHITGMNIAEKKLKDLGYPEEKIEKVVHCIFSHRGSQNIARESIEAEIIAEADAMSHFDNIPGLFYSVFVFEKKDPVEARLSVKQKLINSYNKLSDRSKKIIDEKFKGAMVLLS